MSNIELAINLAMLICLGAAMVKTYVEFDPTDWKGWAEWLLRVLLFVIIATLFLGALPTSDFVLQLK